MKRSQYPVFELLQARGDFFCPAKWNELYLYLNHGTSNSCHHPQPHAIPKELLSNPSVLHNTPHKLEQQQLMLSGQRPQECHMCWHVEDIDDTVISDRIHKGLRWQDDIGSLQVDTDHVPKLIEVVFDNTCNLTCSYCDSGQSSAWAVKIRNQPYFLRSDTRHLYNKVFVEPGHTQQEYFDAWMRWWPQIQQQVETLRVSGGEPLLSKHFWQFLDSVQSATHLKFEINSNLNVNRAVLTKFANRTKDFQQVTIAASIDAVGSIAEYTRQGLDYNTFLQNVEYWCEHSGPNARLYLQSTVNIFSVWGITDKFDLAIDLRKRYGNRIRSAYSTIVRFPEFQSINILPNDLKQQLSRSIRQWFEQKQHELDSVELDLINKIIAYLNSQPESYSHIEQTVLTKDLGRFRTKYETENCQAVGRFPTQFTDWLQTL